jgi:hypothetical protein
MQPNNMKRELLVNHVGRVPGGKMVAIVPKPSAPDFRLVNLWDGRVLQRGKWRQVGPDLGGWVAELDAVPTGSLQELRSGGKDAGETDLAGGPDVEQAGGQISRVITVDKKVYDPVLRTLFNYFPTQRCGDSVTGWAAPCHTRDAKRADTGEHLDLTGGWHQSCDLRKWSSGTCFGLLGLSQLSLTARPRWDAGRIGAELRWGVDYFKKMCRPGGGLMDHVVDPLDWTQERRVFANDAPATGQWAVLTGLTMAAQVFQSSDPACAADCLEKARGLWAYLERPDRPAYELAHVPRGHDWAVGLHWQQFPGSAIDLGGNLYGAISLYKATGEKVWLEAARKKASQLADLQVGGDPSKNPAAGCFRAAAGREEWAGPLYELFTGLLGLAELALLDSGHPEARAWRRAVETTARQMCLMAQRNPWGLVPCYWFSKHPGGGQDSLKLRPAGTGFYRYFHERWQGSLGLNWDILGAALFLVRAWKLTGDRACLDTAMRQVDWVLGCNPFDASTVEGVGRNQPERHVNIDEFFPPVPQIPGAVMTGITGGADDEPAQFSMGVESEYDMPPTSMLMWLLSELSQA